MVLVDTVLFENLHFSLGLQITFLHFFIFVISSLQIHYSISAREMETPVFKSQDCPL